MYVFVYVYVYTCVPKNKYKELLATGHCTV